MSWTIEGQYFENCTCDVVCPCTASLALGADKDRCRAVMVFHVDHGTIEDVGVDDLTIVAVADTPKFMHEGNWRLGVLVDEAATEEQAAKLGAVFSGSMGGPMEGLVPLIGESMGTERVPMQYSFSDGRHRLTLGEVGVVEAEEIVPFGVENGETVQLTRAFHPASSTLTVARAGESAFSAFGLEPALAGQSAFAASFAWSG